MGTHLDARTNWEVDAARRREVIEGSFEARRTLRAAEAETREVAGAASPGLLSTLRAVFSPSAESVDDFPCQHSDQMKAAKRGA
jgi:hypothetical protein